MRTISEHGLNHLKRWEGSVIRDELHRPYDDATGEEVSEGENWVGYLTIGYGHLLDRSELNSEVVEIGDELVYYWKGLTEEEALKLLDQDVDWAEDTVRRNVKVPLNQSQFDALVSFTFNIGPNAFKNSTLLKLLNQGLYNEVPYQMSRWKKSGGRVVNGLIRRRQHEAELWNS